MILETYTEINPNNGVICFSIPNDFTLSVKKSTNKNESTGA